MKIKAALSGLLFAGIMVSGAAQGVLLSMDLDVQDDALVTADTLTGLNWLDLTITRDYSVNQILTGKNGRNFISEGWRYASIDEVHQLIGNAGLLIEKGLLPTGQTVYYVQQSDIGQLSAITNLLNRIGINYNSGYDEKTWGWTSPFALTPMMDGSIQPSSVAINCCRDYFSNPNKAATIVFHNEGVIQNSGYSLDSHQSQFGSFLVKQSLPIPEPGSLALLGLALSGLAVSRRKQIKAS